MYSKKQAHFKLENNIYRTNKLTEKDFFLLNKIRFKYLTGYQMNF